MPFTVDLREIIEKAKSNAEQVVRKVAIDMHARCIDRSPVGNPSLWQNPPPPGYVGGRFRANNQVSLNAPIQTELDRVDADGAETKAAGAAVLAAYNSSVSSIWLTNSVSYVIPLEFGHSTQAPAGVYRITAGEFRQFINKAVLELVR